MARLVGAIGFTDHLDPPVSELERHRAKLEADGSEPLSDDAARQHRHQVGRRQHAREQHNVIERLFGRLKGWRPVATRCDSCAHRFMSAICIAATVIFRISQ